MPASFGEYLLPHAIPKMQASFGEYNILSIYYLMPFLECLLHLMSTTFDDLLPLDIPRMLASFVVVVVVFYGPLTLFRSFGHGQLTYPHCSWASLRGSLPVLSAHFFANN